MLDECEARVILLLAPAGYGKTTLARQWARRCPARSGSRHTAHRDVVTLAEDLAAGVDALGGNASKFTREYLSAQSNPQRSARGVAARSRIRSRSSASNGSSSTTTTPSRRRRQAEQLFMTVRERAISRLLVTSRTRPSWADGRSVIYGDNAEVHRDQLAMTDEESAQLFRSRSASASLAERAGGWPAALALAAATDVPLPPAGSRSLPGALHRYLAEELFQESSSELRAALLTISLVGTPPEARLNELLGGSADAIVDEARALGFDSGDEGPFELHPLIREFLLDKVREEPDSDDKVRFAINLSLEEGWWDNALDLVIRLRFSSSSTQFSRRRSSP